MTASPLRSRFGRWLVPAAAVVLVAGVSLAGSRMASADSDLAPRTAAFVLRLTERIVAESQLTTMMVTHSMRQALDVGERVYELQAGRTGTAPGENRAAAGDS